jgi:glycosyltransferase involved in cell wall biosynthesis
MTRRVLIFAYWFPPANVIGASRPLAIAHYFKKKGWFVTVVCGASDAVSRDFSANLDGIEVIYVPDTWDTKFLNFKSGRSKLMRAVSACFRIFVLPDAFRSTVKKMCNVARLKLIKSGRFDLIIASALPFSLHSAALKVGVEFNIPVVLDNRDFWACSPYRRRIPLTCWMERFFERRVFAKSDLVVAISESMAEIYKSHHPRLSEKFMYVRNGTDSNIAVAKLSTRSSGAKFVVVYTGILYGSTRDLRPALRAFERLGADVVVNFYGSEVEQVANYKREFPEIEIIDCGRVSRDESLAAQRSADALLIGLGNDSIEQSFLPGKFFEYVSSGRPIIALADEKSEVARLISRHGIGIASRVPEEIRAFVKALQENSWTRSDRHMDELSRENQLDRFFASVDALVEDRSESE